MLRSLVTCTRGTFLLVVVAIHTCFWAIPLYACAIAKAVLPWGRWRRMCSKALSALGELWIDTNNVALRCTRRLHWDVEGLAGLRRDRSYLLNSNHQSWTDIMVLQLVFNRRIPFLRFFIKKELFWVPVLGLAWWALDMPFMKRYPRALLERHPHLRGKDMATTRKSCERLRQEPVTIMNFLEGTRFTPEKHHRQDSPYRHLLRPKAGGIAFVLGAMGTQLSSMLDVTIVYPEFRPTFWDFVSGRVSHVIVRVKEEPIPADFAGGDYHADPRFRERIQEWVGRLWVDKDALIDRVLEEHSMVGQATGARASAS